MGIAFGGMSAGSTPPEKSRLQLT